MAKGYSGSKRDSSDDGSGVAEGRVDYGDDAMSPSVSRGMEPPEGLRKISREDRAILEKKLVRKIDTRLLPMIIL